VPVRSLFTGRYFGLVAVIRPNFSGILALNVCYREEALRCRELIGDRAGATRSILLRQHQAAKSAAQSLLPSISLHLA
jgi:hypothetical protein